MAPPCPAVPQTPVGRADPSVARPTGPQAWPIPCTDAAGRRRYAYLHRHPDGSWTLRVPPGESATFGEIGIVLLLGILGARPGGDHA